MSAPVIWYEIRFYFEQIGLVQRTIYGSAFISMCGSNKLKEDTIINMGLLKKF